MSSNIFYKNTEIARKYGVSNPTIGEWIEQARQNKNTLKIDKFRNKYKILITPHNEIELNRLAKKAKKYIPGNFNAKRTPDKSFYTFFKQEEVLEIVNDLKFKKQIKHKYVYKDPKYWNNFYKAGRPESTFSELKLMDKTINDIQYYLKGEKNINLIEIGQGNALPAISIIEKLGNVRSYVGIDLSEKMNKLAEKNIKETYPALKASFYIRDIENSPFGDILHLAKGELNTRNLIMSLGSTVGNIDDRVNVYKNISRSMDEKDLFIVDFSLDSMEAKSSLAYIKDVDGLMRDGWHLKLMGIDIEKCEVEILFNQEKNYKDKLYILDKNYDITFNVYNHQKTIRLEKGDKISTWRHYLQSLNSLNIDLIKAGFEVLLMKIDNTSKYGLAVCRILGN